MWWASVPRPPTLIMFPVTMDGSLCIKMARFSMFVQYNDCNKWSANPVSYTRIPVTRNVVHPMSSSNHPQFWGYHRVFIGRLDFPVFWQPNCNKGTAIPLSLPHVGQFWWNDPCQMQWYLINQLPHNISVPQTTQWLLRYNICFYISNTIAIN